MTAPPTMIGPPRTPRPGQRARERARWIRRVLVGLLIGLLTLAASGTIYQTVATALDRRAYPPPGPARGCGRLPAASVVHRQPDRGPSQPSCWTPSFPGTVSTWAWVQPELAKTTRVCAYDRAGLGWSDPGPAPRDATQPRPRTPHLAPDTRGSPGPYVLVGHSLGGLSVRMYADQYPDDVAGMVLIEGTNPDAWQRLGTPEGVGVDPHPAGGRAVPGPARRLPPRPDPGAWQPDPDLPPRQRAELQAFFNSSSYLDTVRAVDTRLLRGARPGAPRTVDSAQRRWRLCWEARATAAWNRCATCFGSRPRSRPTAAR